MIHPQPKAVTVRTTHRYDAPPKRVFDAWLDPKQAGKWLFATENGKMARVEIDPRVGGSFCIVERRDGEDTEHIGEYLEIDRPHRIVFNFSVPKHTKESTRVTIDITPLTTGCELTLTHEGVWPDYKSRTEEGWRKILDGLAAMLN